MAPVQQTFSLIPELPSALHGHGGDQQQQGRISRPPMTTKQAKKAYKAKNKGPKLSKAEQRRQDLMEQDRIRREFEKERNQARAKAARDKRKEKEDREKAEKKKKGIPLVEVHPSQDTLARFVRRPTTPTVGPKSKTDSSGFPGRRSQSPRDQRPDSLPVVCSEEDDSDATLPAEDEPERPTKRQRTEESPRALPVIEHELNGMFKKPITKPDIDPGIDQTRNRASQHSQTNVMKEPTATSTSLDPDDPIVENMVNRQILNESFSADDGLFDDIDLDAIEMQTVAQHATRMTRMEPNIALSRPPDPRSSPGKDQPVVQKGTIDQMPDQKQVLVASYPKQPVQMRRDDGKRAVEYNNLNRKSLSNEETPKNYVIERPSVDEDVATPAALAATSRNSCSGSRATKAHRRLLLVTEQQDRKPLQELPIKQSGHSVQMQNAQANSSAVSEQTRIEQTPKRSRPSPKSVLNGSSVFLSPKTPSMGPPPLPPKFKTHGQPISGNGLHKPKFLPRQHPTHVLPKRESESPAHLLSTRTDLPPSSTQLFLQSFADDLFPSPSQEIAELLDEPTSGLQGPSTHSKSASVASPLRPSRIENKRDNQLSRPFSRDNTQKNRTLSHGRTKRHEPQAPVNNHRVTTRKPQLPEPPNIDMPFLLTQDILLSSQDLIELEDEPLVPLGRLRPSNDRVSTNIVPPNSILNPQMHSIPRQNYHTTAITGKSIAMPEGMKSTKSSSVESFKIPGAASLRAKHADDLPQTPSGTLAHRKPEPLDKDPPYGNRTVKKTQARELETGDLTSSFTDDELAELFSEDLEIERDDPEPAETKAPSQVVPQRTPIQRHSSPKPFFTSSGTKERFILAFEKSRNDTWRNEQARRQGQEELDVLCREEEERQQRVLTDKLLEAEEHFERKADAVDLVVDNSNKRQRACSSSAKSSNGAPRSQNSATSSNKARQRNYPHGSFEKMCEMLKEKQALENTKEAIIPASQGSDYGDFGLDLDDLPCL
ncbi:hypothetical protein PFICI_12687 [Pestalotiopsis fici W106-1]|uniref:Uncharacterized protein n=1 Tax=Pestalotiopsis fici (strain W106-1 / CGMCC3.15140) TaxID=1229662 RepID=W3WPH0_PESFW|nr:uncharacterized protein PFICI_12687 [Pestalotiopsis fici W106-1]ETS75743.1 hypothetical protein PFICI_12687 [Pestalotiopsis fici W106-1]